nr:NUDIX hydrolase [Micromonospora sp. DSM 115978]
SDAANTAWRPVADLLDAPGRLAFDHATILADGVERARSKIEYTPLATAFCPSEFTVADLRRVYETVWGVRLDPRNFHRKVTGTPGFLTATGRTSRRDGGRPAELFRRGAVTALHPAMLRPARTLPN